MALLIILVILLAYFLGSVPTAVWIGKYIYRVDIKTAGSGNPGTTNVLRVLGLKPAIAVLILDVFKGFAAANIPFLIVIFPVGSMEFTTLQLSLGLIAALGHIFPVFASFKGGKGIATLFGMTLALFPEISLVSSGIFILVLLLTNYVSVSSIIAGICLPLQIIFLFNIDNETLKIISLAIPLLILLTHQKNIKRLLNREENQIHLFRIRGGRTK